MQTFFFLCGPVPNDAPSGTGPQACGWEPLPYRGLNIKDLINSSYISYCR